MDSSFIADYHHELILRTFGSRKYTTYGLYQDAFADRLRYQPNSPFNVGFGFNYKLIGLNLGFNLPIINQTNLYGKTRFLDLQSHIYGRMLTVDFYLQWYKGFYVPNQTWFGLPLRNSFSQSLSPDTVYRRPDFRILNSGVELQYLLNGQKFTFRGAFLQNEVQLKSAGSPIFGIYLGSVSVAADSSIIPTKLPEPNFFDGFRFYRSEMITVNASLGYAYSLVLPHSLFVTFAASGALGMNNAQVRLANGTSVGSLGLNVMGTVRLGMGYNGRRYFAGIHYVGTRSHHHSPVAQGRQQLGAGNFRISLAHRITPKKKLFGFY